MNKKEHRRPLLGPAEGENGARGRGDKGAGGHDWKEGPAATTAIPGTDRDNRSTVTHSARAGFACAAFRRLCTPLPAETSGHRREWGHGMNVEFSGIRVRL